MWSDILIDSKRSRDTDYTARYEGTCVAILSLYVSIADTRTSTNWVRSIEHDFIIGDGEPTDAILSSLDVTNIAGVFGLLAPASLSPTFRVPVWTSCLISLAHVTEHMDMQSVKARI